MAYDKTISDALIKGNTWPGYQIDIGRTGFNFTGTTVKAQFKRSSTDPVLLELTPTPLVATNNLFSVVVSLTAAQSDQLPPGDLIADVQLTTPTTRETPVLIRLKITQNITS